MPVVSIQPLSTQTLCYNYSDTIIGKSPYTSCKWYNMCYFMKVNCLCNMEQEFFAISFRLCLWCVFDIIPRVCAFNGGLIKSWQRHLILHIHAYTITRGYAFKWWAYKSCRQLTGKCNIILIMDVKHLLCDRNCLYSPSIALYHTIH